jgi:glycosyltransferase involved in cell wall biosynthesis
VFPGFGVGGAQVRFAALANRLGASCRHSIVALNGELACREKLVPGLEVTFPPALHVGGRMLAAIAHARRFLLRAAPDLVVTSNWGAIEWAAGAKLAGLDHLHTEDGFGPEEQATQIKRRVLTRRLVLRRSDVVVPSQRLQTIATTIWRLPARRVHLISNGIDLERFRAAAPMPLPPGSGPVIGTVAALRPEKNVGRLLRAFAALRVLRPARLVVAGDGPERDGLERLARALGIADDTVFSGHTTQSERWLAAMDVFALSSDTEQMPLSLLEAMASGLPAVCTDVGDVRLMLAPANAPYVVAREDAALTAGLAAVLDANGPALGAANRAKAERDYDQEAMFQAYATRLGVTLPLRQGPPP